MNINQRIHGFVVTGKRKIKELDAEMYEMTFEKNGAKLVWLDRDDSNKTFAITFRTVPSDSTGVFHILEHSVLCGSEKYPLKEPFVDLLKGSMQTFLNAMTFLDKTMYPVASRNDKDFLNLIDVYMDAVLHPLIHSKKEIFMQEGWHYEPDENGQLHYNGVVYNEMRGVFSSVEERIIYELLARLFPDVCYGKVSGGNPENIPELTYEQFVEAHKRFYHPSNSTIFLDGRVQLESILSLLESYLAPYDMSNPNSEIPTQHPVQTQADTIAYEANEHDAVFGTTEIAKGYVTANFDEREKIAALDVLQDVLCSTNESPLKKAVLENGLAKDIYFESSDETKQRVIFLVLRGVKDENTEKARQTVAAVFDNLVQNGIDKKQLVAALNNLEFKTREKDFGTEPAGLIYAMQAQETWLYGGDPYDALVYDDIFETLRKKINSDYFEKLLEDTFVTNNHTAEIFMVPDKGLSAQKAKAENEKLEKIKNSLSNSEKEQLKLDLEKLKVFQNTEDSPEQSALIKHIEISDIEKKPEELPLEVFECQGNSVLFSNVKTDNIVYTDLYFSLDGLDEEELCCASVMSSMLAKNATENHTAGDLTAEIMTYLGSFSCNAEALNKSGEKQGCSAYFVVSVGALEKNKDKILSLVPEILSQTVFDPKKVSDICGQIKLSYENSLKNAGHRHAMLESRACLSESGAVNRLLSGSGMYDYICRNISCSKELCVKMKTLSGRIFSADRLTLSLIGKRDEDFCGKLISSFVRTGEEIKKISYPLFENKNNSIAVTSDVSYAAKGYNLADSGAGYSGKVYIAAKILSLDYLWNEVRVKGGAYGCGAIANRGGDIMFYSFRDPNPNGSLTTYDNSGSALRAFARKNGDVAKYIIGAVSATEPILTAYAKGRNAAVLFLSGVTYEDRCKTRTEMLCTTCADLEKLSSLFDLENKNCAVCVIGPQR